MDLTVGGKMRVIKKRVGDIYINPVMGDIWILNYIWSHEEEKDVWMLNLVNEDCQEQLKYVKGFIRVGNIYDLLNEKYNKKAK